MIKKIASVLSLILAPTMALAGSIDPPAVVPEPGTLLLFAGGIGAAVLLERKRRQKKG